MRTRKICFLLAFVTTGVAASGLAQAPNDRTPSINGVVRDAGNNPIGDAQLSLLRPNEPARLFRTGADGKYSFTPVAPGDVQVTVRRLGYRGSSKSIAVAPASGPNALDFQLIEVPNDMTDVIVE